MSETAEDRAKARQKLEWLIGRDQGWLARCKAAVAAGQEAAVALADLSDDLNAIQLAADPWLVDNDRERLLGDDVVDRPALVSAQRIAAMAQAMAGAGDLEVATTRLLDCAQACGLVSVPDGPPDGEFIGRVPYSRHAFGADHPSSGYVALLIAELTGELDRSHLSTETSMAVLFDRRIGGAVGRLRLSVLRGGPPGLHPDPRTMSFLQADVALCAGARVAWQQSALASSGLCVLWSVTDDGTPCNEIRGGSLSAAFAVALNDLAPTTGWTRKVVRWLRPRRLDRRSTVTAGLDGPALTEVRGYQPKLAAAGRQGIRVVVAASGYAAALRECDEPLGNALLSAGTVSEAIRKTRRRINPRLYVVTAVTLAITTVVLLIQYAARSEVAAQQQARTAAQLAQRSLAVANSDPRLAALLALASDKLEPTTESRDAMLRVIQNNESVMASAKAADGPITEVAVVGDHTLMTASTTNILRVWQLPNLEPVGEITLDSAPSGLSVNDATLAVQDGAKLRIYQAARARGYVPQAITAIDTSLTDQSQNVLGPYISQSSGAVLVMDEDLNGTLYSPLTRSTHNFAISNDPDLARLSGRPPSATVGSGFTERPESFPDPEGADYEILREDTLLIGTEARQILRLTASFPTGRATGEMKFDLTPVVDGQKVRAGMTALALDMDGTAYIGTLKGVQALSLADGETKEFPFGGVSERIDGIIEEGRNLVVRTPSGLAVMIDGVTRRIGNVSETTRAVGAITSFAPGGFPFSLDGRVIIGRQDGRVATLDPTNRRLGLPAERGTNVVGFTGRGHLITSATTADSTTFVDSIELTSLPRRPPPDITISRTFELPRRNNVQPYVNAVTSTDRVLVASGLEPYSHTGSVWVWNIRNRRLLHTLPFSRKRVAGETAPDIVSNVAIAPALKLLVAYNPHKGSLGLWSLDDFQPQGEVDVPPQRTLEGVQSTSMSTSARGDRALISIRSTGKPTELTLIDLASRKAAAPLRIPAADSAELSPDGSTIALTVGNQVRLYSTDGKDLGRSVTLTSPPNGLSWSPDGSRLAAASANSREITFVDTASMRQLGPSWRDPKGYQPIMLSWSASGEYLAVGTARIEDGRIMHGETQILRPTSIAWSADLCAIAGTDLTPDEWKREVGPDYPYRELCG